MTLPLSKIESLKHLITHAHCPDGTMSAMLLAHFFPDLTVTYVQYGSEEHRNLEVLPYTIFCDFSPHPDQVEDFVRAEAVVLDHHKTAESIVARFGDLGVYGDEDSEPGVCGAVLALREICVPLFRKFLPDHEPRSYFLFRALENYAILAGIRDTWQRSHPRWREACEQASAIGFWPNEDLVGRPPEEWKSKFEIGKILFQKKLNSAERCGNDAYRFLSQKGTRVAIFQNSRMASDTAEYLDTEADLVIGFDVAVRDGEPTMVFSARSHTFYDCGKLAKAHGGGGHTKAAGFRRLLRSQDPQPFELLKKLVDDYEAGNDR